VHFPPSAMALLGDEASTTEAKCRGKRGRKAVLARGWRVV
jgi:hypothetical protein